MKRIIRFASDNLLCAASLAFAAGIASVSWPLGISWQIPLLFAFGVLILLLSRYRKADEAAVMALVFFAVLGNLYAGISASVPADPLQLYRLIPKEKEAVVIGRLHTLQGFNGETSKGEIDCDFVRFKTSADFIPTTGRILLIVKGPWPAGILPGDRIAVRAVFRRPHSLQTAGSFDYVTYLQNKGIRLTGFVGSPFFLHTINTDRSLTDKILYAAGRSRSRIGSIIDQNLPQRIAGIYKALLIGDRSGIAPDLLEQFKAAGCMHILSISGMHMAIIGVLIFASLYWLMRRWQWLILHSDVKKIAAAACLPILVFYALLAGGNTPVVRSLVMSIIVIVALCLNRQKSIFATLALAMLLLLAWRPESLFTASFQLTFAAVASIAAIFPILSQRLSSGVSGETTSPLLSRLGNWIIAALMISVAVTIGIAPLLLRYFNRLSLVGPFANLVVEPLICFWALPFGFLACFFAFFSPPMAGLLLRAGAPAITVACSFLGLLQKIPLENIWLPTPSPYEVMAYYGSLLLLFWGRNHSRPLYRLGWLTLAATLVFLRLPPYELCRHFKKDSTITVIDIGQGSANLIEFPGGKRALVDGGGPVSPRFDVGERIIAAFLWKKGITSIDSVIITHPDADHYDGLPFIIKHFGPKTLWINGSSGHDPSYTKLLELAGRLGISIKTPPGGERLVSGGGANLLAIANPLTSKRTGTIHQTGANASPISSNDAGLIVKFIDGRFAALFPGDITKRVEHLLVERPKRLSADILLSPHHGSSTSNSRAFLRAVHPAFLIVSAGYRKYGTFPAWDLKEKSAKIGIRMLTTARFGCIVISTDGTMYSMAAGNGYTKERKIVTDLAARQDL